ncbi:MAG: hypothetical protein KKA07_05125 [Bacteroidetes bacterium]|nr:hypothetical protein [Bacteroidota bacterium]
MKTSLPYSLSLNSTLSGRRGQGEVVVQAPDATMGLNRYSYALGNPLAFTDPSGYEVTGGPISNQPHLQELNHQRSMERYDWLNSFDQYHESFDYSWGGGGSGGGYSALGITDSDNNTLIFTGEGYLGEKFKNPRGSYVTNSAGMTRSPISAYTVGAVWYSGQSLWEAFNSGEVAWTSNEAGWETSAFSNRRNRNSINSGTTTQNSGWDWYAEASFDVSLGSQATFDINAIGGINASIGDRSLWARSIDTKNKTWINNAEQLRYRIGGTLSVVSLDYTYNKTLDVSELNLNIFVLGNARYRVNGPNIFDTSQSLDFFGGLNLGFRVAAMWGVEVQGRAGGIYQWEN